jgi:hypothetical protein
MARLRTNQGLKPTVDRCRQVDAPAPQGYLPLVDLLVDLLVDTQAEPARQAFAATDSLNRRVVQQMLIGVAKRQDRGNVR